MSFANLKKSSKETFETLTKKLESEKSGGYKEDTRYWNFEVDKTGNGFAVIRFLPPAENEEYPFVKLYSHSFKDERTQKWYIENSRTTINDRDPVSEANKELWDTGIPANQEIVRKRKRKTSYIANILVISNPKKPEDEGKVFLWKFGPRIFQKIEGAMKPEFEDETPFNPFDFWTGANFKLKARMLDGQRSYDKSEFEKPSALFDGDDAALEKLWKSLYSLQAEIAPDKFKPYDVLKKRFESVIGKAQPSVSEPMTPPAPAQTVSARPQSTAVVDDTDDDDLAAYTRLLEE